MEATTVAAFGTASAKLEEAMVPPLLATSAGEGAIAATNAVAAGAYPRVENLKGSSIVDSCITNKR